MRAVRPRFRADAVPGLAPPTERLGRRCRLRRHSGPGAGPRLAGRPDRRDRFWITKLFKEVSFGYGPRCLPVLSEWIKSGDPTRIEAATALLRDAPAAFVFDHFDFVSNAISRAAAAGDECYEAVSSNLYACAVYTDASVWEAVHFRRTLPCVTRPPRRCKRHRPARRSIGSTSRCQTRGGEYKGGSRTGRRDGRVDRNARENDAAGCFRLSPPSAYKSCSHLRHTPSMPELLSVAENWHHRHEAAS